MLSTLRAYDNVFLPSVLFLTITAAAFLIADTVSVVLKEAFQPNDTPAPVTPAKPPTPGAADVSALIADVLSSTIFTGDSGSKNSERSSEGDRPRGTLHAAQKIKMVGRVSGTTGWTFAVVEDVSTKQQALYRLHDEISNLGRIIRIESDGMLIAAGKEREFLPLAVPSLEQAQRSVTELQNASVGTIRRTLERRELIEQVSDIGKLLTQARAVPVLVNGKLGGWRLDMVARQSFYESAGLRVGDVLVKLNGSEIRDPAMLMALLQQVKDERAVNLELIRGHQHLVVHYEIR